MIKPLKYFLFSLIIYFFILNHVNAAGIDNQLDLKTSSTDIFEYELSKDNKTVIYSYTTKEVPIYVNEIAEKRTFNSITYSENGKFKTRFYSGSPFYNSGKIWLQTETATTTLDTWLKQYQVDTLSKMKNWLFPKALADIFYSGSGDGYIRQANLGNTWANTHDAISGDNAYITQANIDAIMEYYQPTGKFYGYRAFLAIDTSAIPDDATIDTASLNIYAISTTDADNDGLDYINIVKGFQNNTSELATGDWENCGSDNGNAARAKYTPQETAAAGIDITGMSISAYTVFDFNSIGKGFINKTGITALGIREGHDIENSAIDTGSGDLQTGASFYNSRQADTTHDPYLEIEWTEGGEPGEPTETATTTKIFIDFMYYTIGSTTAYIFIPFFDYFLVLSVFSFTIFFVWFCYYMIYQRK